MNNQLSNSDKIKVFGLYLGCEVENVSSMRYDPKSHSRVNGKPIMSPSLLADFHEETFQYSWFKLLLRPLSAISDEDKIAWFDLEHPDSISPDSVKIESVDFWIESEAIGYDVADMLREKGYMLPYKGINLFDAGIAISSTEINK